MQGMTTASSSSTQHRSKATRRSTLRRNKAMRLPRPLERRVRRPQAGTTTEPSQRPLIRPRRGPPHRLASTLTLHRTIPHQARDIITAFLRTKPLYCMNRGQHVSKAWSKPHKAMAKEAGNEKQRHGGRGMKFHLNPSMEAQEMVWQRWRSKMMRGLAIKLCPISRKLQQGQKFVDEMCRNASLCLAWSSFT